MPTYYYKALSKEGHLSKGHLSAASLKDARDQLRLKELNLIQLSKAWFIGGTKKNRFQLLAFTRELKQLLEAGLPLYESLNLISECSSTPDNVEIVTQLRDKIKQGLSFSQATCEFSNHFDARFRAICHSSEVSGSLPEGIKEMASYLEKEAEFRRKMVSALTYPALLVAVSFVVVLLLLLFVVPTMETLIDKKKAAGITFLILSLSSWLYNHYLLILGSVTGFLAILFYKKESLIKGDKAFAFYIKIPLVKDLLIKSKLAVFFRLLATLQKGGIPLVEALEYSVKSLASHKLESMILQSKKNIIEGSRFSKELKNYPIIPNIVISLLTIGEETGSYVESFTKIAELFEKETEKTLERLSILIQPLILIIMAIVIGSIMLAILLPLTDISAWLGDGM